MKLTTALYGLAVAMGTVAQNDSYPPLKTDGPYALHVKSQSSNGSIDGYLYAVPEFPGDTDGGVSVLHYDPASVPVAGNSSYRFYFNSSIDDTSDLGFVVTDITVGKATDLYWGRAMFWTYFADTNVALLELGSGADPYNVQFVGFGKDGKGFAQVYHDDSKAVVGQPSHDNLLNIYDSWAICWQTRYTVTGFTLSWITYGKPHNPTCERVDLTRSKIY
ncbi:hypothetical protein F5Y07DRAFT_401390 [Xylaria sp. FL0933]|nr:hypothetical protein F5Y07DRAFT_401390 [Xylaria sp. FL0933]